MDEDFELDVDDEDDPFDTHAHGMDVGISIGKFQAYQETVRAYKAGRIEDYLEAMRPKTIEEWEEWERLHPDKEEW